MVDLEDAGVIEGNRKVKCGSRYGWGWGVLAAVFRIV